MLLIHIIQILFWLIAIKLCGTLVYRSGSTYKKAIVYRGNGRMPKDVMLALGYGLKTKINIRFKDLSYRKSAAEWRLFVNSIYAPDKDVAHAENSTLASNAKGGSNSVARNCEQLLVYTFKKGITDFSERRKNYMVNRDEHNSILYKASDLSRTIITVTNLKNSENPILSAKQISACS